MSPLATGQRTRGGCRRVLSAECQSHCGTGRRLELVEGPSRAPPVARLGSPGTACRSSLRELTSSLEHLVQVVFNGSRTDEPAARRSRSWSVRRGLVGRSALLRCEQAGGVRGVCALFRRCRLGEPSAPHRSNLQCQAHQAAKHLQGASSPTITEGQEPTAVEIPAAPLVSTTKAPGQTERRRAAATVAVTPRRETKRPPASQVRRPDLRVTVTGGN
jgi:hypothetical protein